MALGDFARINTNIEALNALNALQNVGAKMSVHQTRLATGLRLNSVADDPAGYVIGKKMEARTRTLNAALNNIGDFKSMLGIAEGGLLNINDILVTMKEKVLQAASDTLGSAERQAINLQIDQLNSEINDIVDETEFNNVQLIDGTYVNKNFHTGGSKEDTFEITSIADHDAVALGTDQISNISTPSSAMVFSSAQATSALGVIETAMETVSESLENIGSWVNRLSVKENTVSVAISNTEAAFSRIFDADIAKEQLETSKLQILQQTATAMLAQANLSSSNVLALFR
jgi:flagellin